MKILGIVIPDNLSMGGNVAAVMSKGTQALIALKALKSHGLSGPAMASTCRAILLPHLTYAIPAWIGFTSEADRHRLQSALSKASRWRLTGGNTPYLLDELVNQLDKSLFRSVSSNRHPLPVFPLPLTPTIYVSDPVTSPFLNLAPSV